MRKYNNTKKNTKHCLQYIFSILVIFTRFSMFLPPWNGNLETLDENVTF